MRHEGNDTGDNLANRDGGMDGNIPYYKGRTLMKATAQARKRLQIMANDVFTVTVIVLSLAIVVLMMTIGAFDRIMRRTGL